MDVFVDFAHDADTYDVEEGLMVEVSLNLSNTTDEIASSEVMRIYPRIVVGSNEYLVADGDIFIVPKLLRRFNIQNGDKVRGIAVFLYNNKKVEWCWHVVRIEPC